MAIVVVLGAIAGLNLGMVASHVKASEGWYPCHWRGDGFACLNESGEQKPQLQQIDYWCRGNSADSAPYWSSSPCNSNLIQQPHLEQVAYVTNCFWSYPVQCN